jgi:hypothetical protein
VPERLANRGKNLLTKESFFGDLRETIGEPLYQTLTVAHDLRNRVAHDPATAHSTIVEVSQTLGIPQAELKGLSVGRLLRDYPGGGNLSESYFEIFLQAYDFRAFPLFLHSRFDWFSHFVFSSVLPQVLSLP